MNETFTKADNVCWCQWRVMWCVMLIQNMPVAVYLKKIFVILCRWWIRW